MAMMKPNVTEYEFNSIENLLDFIRPLIIEGYTVATRTVFRPYPRENSIDKYIVYVADAKGKELSITIKGDEE